MNTLIKNLDELPAVLTVDELANLLGVDRKVCYRIVKDEKLAVRVGEKRLLVLKHKLIAYLNQ